VKYKIGDIVRLKDTKLIGIVLDFYLEPNPSSSIISQSYLEILLFHDNRSMRYTYLPQYDNFEKIS
jgi:hypothetical protein